MEAKTQCDVQKLYPIFYMSPPSCKKKKDICQVDRRKFKSLSIESRKRKRFHIYIYIYIYYIYIYIYIYIPLKYQKLDDFSLLGFLQSVKKCLVHQRDLPQRGRLSC